MVLTLKNMILLALMLIFAALGTVLRPTIRLADELPPIDLETMVPKAFGEWREDTIQLSRVVNPQQTELLSKIYSQTLTRTYTNRQGYRIMLSIAYGKIQNDTLQLHKPELCYPAQGFVLKDTTHTTLNILGTPIPITRLKTSLGLRNEPVTYWSIVGDENVQSGTNKKLIELHYALHNRIPDGMLLRLSSIDGNAENAYQLHGQFANAALRGIAHQHRARFIGRSV